MTSHEYINSLIKVKNGIVIGLSVLFISVIHESQGQSIYGISGLLKTPNAYTADSGKCMAGIACFRDYHGERNQLYNQWSVFLNIGFHSRIELSVRLTVFPGLTGDTKLYNASFDRMISTKLTVIKERKYSPQLSIGMQDMVGTRYHNSTYIVVSKIIPIRNFCAIMLNSGYGTKLNDLIFGESYNHHFIGFFTGTSINFMNIIELLAEYDAKDFNYGVKITYKGCLNAYFSMLQLKIPAGGLSVKFKL